MRAEFGGYWVQGLEEDALSRLPYQLVLVVLVIVSGFQAKLCIDMASKLIRHRVGGAHFDGMQFGM